MSENYILQLNNVEVRSATYLKATIISGYLI